jgi:hypothetical protein
MRFGWIAVVLVAACSRLPPPPVPEFPEYIPPDTYNTRIANLRTTLGRAGITLKVAGIDDTFSTADCNSETREPFGSCARCMLAGETTRMDGAVIEATTRAFARYPTDVLDATKLAYVSVCREIVLRPGKDVEHPAGLADVRGDGMLISVKYFLDSEYQDGAEFTIDDIAHHEVFHQLEHEHMYSEMTHDAEWQLYNPIGFEYDDKKKHTERQPGFVNAYALTSAVEDKASTYEFLMAHPDELCDMARDDETLKMKARMIARRVRRAVGTDAFIREAAPCVDWLDN